MTFAANETVFSLQFNFTGRTYTGTFGEFVASTPNSTVAGTTTKILNLTGRVYRADSPQDAPSGSSDRAAVKMNDHRFAAGGTYDGDYVEVLLNQPSFNLDDDVGTDDLVSVVPVACTTSGGGGGGEDPQVPAEHMSRCPGGSNVPDDIQVSCDPCETFFFYYSLEIEYTNERGANWPAAVDLVFDASVSTFAETVVKPKFGGGFRWWTEDGSFDHDVNYYHCHDENCEDTSHPYPYNPVSSHHECLAYMGWVDNDWKHALYHHDGIKADKLQVLHEEACTVQDSWGNYDPYGGYADYPGTDSIATNSAWLGGKYASSVSAHEFGHNFGADHDLAFCPTDQKVTIMGSQEGTPCVDGDEDEMLWEFSPDNIIEVDSCVVEGEC